VSNPSRRDEVEASILRAAEELLAEGASFADLGIERIAKRAGIGRTGFYFYFRDKRELLMRLTAGIATQLYARAETWWSGDADLRDALADILELFRAHAPLLKAVVELSAIDDEVAVFWRRLVGRFAEASEARVRDRATAFALVWMTERTFHQQLVQDTGIADADLVSALAGIWDAAAAAT